LYFLLSEKFDRPCIIGLRNWLPRPRKQRGWRHLKMALDGFSGYKAISTLT
jgi:hypothetical protein